jgi:hypothetical protein
MIQAGIVRIVAPRASGEQLVRWEESFNKTRSYCKEAGIELVEFSEDSCGNDLRG